MVAAAEFKRYEERMNPKIKTYIVPVIPVIVFILSPFWNNYLHEDNSRMTFSYWLHWFVIYGGGGLVLFALGYCFWGGVQLRINKVKKQYDKETEILCSSIDASRKEKAHFEGRIRELTNRHNDKMDKLRKENEILKNTDVKNVDKLNEMVAAIPDKKVIKNETDIEQIKDIIYNLYEIINKPNARPQT